MSLLFNINANPKANCFSITNTDLFTDDLAFTNWLLGQECIRCNQANTPDFGDLSSDLYNCNLCPNDIAYFQPVKAGEKIYFQFNYDDRKSIDPNNPNFGWNATGEPNVLISAKVINNNTEAYEHTFVDTFADYVVGVDQDENQNYQNLRVDVDSIAADCFLFEFTVDLGFTKGSITFFSEPFIKESCIGTVTVEGKFTPQLDENGKYYSGLANIKGNTNFSYRDLYRVQAELELNSYQFNREVTEDNRLISAQATDVYGFRTKRIPPYMAAKIANTFTAKEIIIDDIALTEVASLDKNNDIGSMWMIEAELTEEQKELNYLCT